MVVQFKQEPFPKLTTLTKGQGKLSLGEKFLTIVALHRVDGGFELWARGDMTAPPAGNPGGASTRSGGTSTRRAHTEGEPP